MTLCIAAICEHKGEHAIAMCSDSQATHGDYFKSQDEYKWRFEGGFVTLLSGKVSAADELIATLAPILREFDRAGKPTGDFDLRITAFIQKFVIQ